MRKRYFLALAGCFFLLHPAARGQNLVKANVLTPLLQTGSFYYERVIDDTFSAQLGLFFTRYEELSGFGVTPELRFYLSETPAPDGFYVGPFLGFMRFTVEESDFGRYKGTSTNFGGGLVAGRQWIFKDRISFDLFIGPEFTAGSVKVAKGSKSDIENAAFSGWVGRGGISLGFKF